MNESDDALLAAVQWLDAVLLGPVATAVATLAVAVVGLRMLNGSTDFRRALTVLGGCFIVFGAPAIASGLRMLATPEMPRIDPLPPELPPPPTPIRPPPQKSDNYDPYAGAAVPSLH